MKQKWLGACCSWVATVVLVIAPVITPSTALARQQEPERDIVDARLEGYAGNMTLPGGGTSLTWVLLVVLGVLACAGLFKDAKRSHLD